MAEFFAFRWQTTTLEDALEELGPKAVREVGKVIKATTKRAYKIAKNKTPVRTGKAFSSWKQSTEKGGLEGIVSNDVPYINLLEYGSYPVRPISRASGQGDSIKRGRAYLGGSFPPFKHGGEVTRTTRAPSSGEPKMLSPGNVSKEAPRGMVRLALIEVEPQFVLDLEEALDRAWAT